MREILKKMRVLLDAKQKRTMAGLIVLMVIGAFLQTAGVGLLVQAVNLIIDPKAVQDSMILGKLYQWIGRGNYERFSVTVMLLLVVVFVVKNVFLYIQQKCTFAFVYTNQFRTSERMMRNYLRRGYEFYLNADTAVIQRNITSDVNNMYALILALLQLLSDGVVSLFIISYCFLSNGVITVMMAVVMGVLMLVIKKVLKPILFEAGRQNQDYYSGLFKWISQTVLGMKEVKIFCKEQYFVQEYQKCGKGYVNAVQRYSLYNNIPKLLIETACVATMMLYMIFQVLSGASTQDMMSVLKTLAAAAFVLLPCVNRINNQLNSISYFEPFFMGVSDHLQEEISEAKVDLSFAGKSGEKLPIRRSIALHKITYAYPGTDRQIFTQADLLVPVGASVGIVGTTGVGKSTVVDILLGLLKPTCGQILVDDVPLGDNYRRFLQNVGYIPQMIFMLDDTIRRNVAFGVGDDEIDEARVWDVLREAKLDTFVAGLPEGLDTGIGERGIRLSGGQRQRISIARALYHNPEVLILDEATSALDNDTEAAIMDSINHFLGKKTLIIIAHRLQTIEKCDIVYRVQDGRLCVERGHKLLERVANADRG